MRTEFIEETCKLIMCGQAVMYVNSPEECRLVTAIRHAGWLMTPSPEDPDPAEYPEKPSLSDPGEAGSWETVNKVKDRVSAALAYAGVDAAAVTAYRKKRVVDPKVFVDALGRLDKMPADDEDAADQVVETAATLREVLDHTGYPTFVWNQNEGFEHDGTYVDELQAAIQCMKNRDNGFPARCLVVFKDAHMHINTSEGPRWRRAIRNVYEFNDLVGNGLSRHLFFVQTYLKPHPDVAHCFVKADFARPNDAELDVEVSNAQQGIVDPSKRQCSPELRAELVRSLRGLDAANVAKTLSLCIVEHKGFHPDMVRRVRSMRSRQLASGQGLKIIDPDDPELTMQGSLGGYENVRELIDDVILCRQPEAAAVALKTPTGFGLAGPPGCLHPDTPVYDPADGTTRSVLQRYEEGKDFTVGALDAAAGRVVQARAEAPHRYPAASMLKFTLANGRQVVVTHGHKFWDGETYVTAGELAARIRQGEKVRLPVMPDGGR